MKQYNLIITIIFATIISGCASTTIIKSEPSGAKIYVDGMRVGETPYVHTDSKIVGSSTILKFKKDGYDDLDAVMSKSEKANIGAIIGGVFVLVPFLWTMEYNPERTYELSESK
jgi:hypothetical protein